MKQLLMRMATSATILATPTYVLAQFGEGDVGLLEGFLQPIRPFDGQGITLDKLVVTLLNFMVMIAAILAIVYLIWAGIKYITAGTDDEQAKKAKLGIQHAIIGIVIIILSALIIQFVSNVVRGAVTNRGVQTERGRIFNGQ